MPREPRAFEPDAVYHLISRFIGHEFFVTNQLQRNCYTQLHGRSLSETDWRWLGFAVMSNHVHLVALAGRRTLDSWLRPVHSPFADLLNHAHERIGPIFVRGPKAFVVEPRDVARLLAYVHNNPVRASVVKRASESRWTSHRAYIGKADVPRGLDVGLGLSLAGVSRADFDALINDPTQLNDRSFSEEAHELQLEREREARVLPKRAFPEVARAIVEATAAAVDVPVTKLVGSSRGATEVFARSVAVSCSAMFGVHEVDIARALNLSQQRVSVLRRSAPSNDVVELATVVELEVRGLVSTYLRDDCPADVDAAAAVAPLSSK